MADFRYSFASKNTFIAYLFGAAVMVALSPPGNALAKAAINPNSPAKAEQRPLESAPVLISKRHRKRGRRGKKKESGDSDNGQDNEFKSRIRRRVGRDFKHADKDDDGKLSRAEWLRRGNFDRLDTDDDGSLSLPEVLAMYQGHDEKSYDWPPDNMRKATPATDASAAKDLVPSYKPESYTICAITRGKECLPTTAVELGLLETGLGPVFPENAVCPAIDDYFALDYTFKRGKEAYHGGIDMPVRWGTPMIAVADGTVVGKFKGDNSKRGIEISIRHSPDDTGIPFWIYSNYGHLDKMPEQEIGQRVQKGEVLGPTGNSGLSGSGGKQSTLRRPAIHFAVFYSENPNYALVQEIMIPIGGRWMDPIALYRQKAPYDTSAMKALPEEEKGIPTPIMFEDGKTSPAAPNWFGPIPVRAAKRRRGVFPFRSSGT